MKKRAIVIIPALAAIAALVGCGRAAPSESRMKGGFADSEVMTMETLKAPAPEPAAGGSTAQTLPLPEVQSSQSRMIIKTASVSVLVKDVDAAFARAVQLAEGSGGYVQSSTRSSEAGERADLTVKLPPDGFLAYIAAVEALGKSQSKSIAGQDVTEEYYDLQAELENLTQVRSRLFKLLDEAKKVSDAIEVERELERVGGDINRITGRMKYLQTMVGMSTVNLTLSTEARPASQSFINWNMVGFGFVRAAQILVGIILFVLQALVVVVPIGAFVTVGILTTRHILRGRRKNMMGGKPSKGK